MQIIRNWLNGSRNFTAGATLYKAIGSNAALKNMLDKGETVFTTRLLAQELEKLSKDGVPKVVKPIPVEKESAVMQESDDQVLQAINDEWTPLYQKMNFLRHRLDKEFEDMNSAEAIAFRKPIAKEIIELEQQCIGLWKKKHYYEKHGKLPLTPKKSEIPIPTDPVELATLISNLKKNITRNRKLMKESASPARFAELYNEYKEKYKHVTGKDYAEKD